MIVSNASPIHYLVLTGSISVLQDLYETVLIPAAVRDELLRAETPPAVQEWMCSPPDWLEVHTDPLQPHASMLRDVGEAQAIALALAVGAQGILLDDRKARGIARREGLLVVGTLGVLQAAADQGLVDFCPTLERLQQTNFRADVKLVQTLLERALASDLESPVLEGVATETSPAAGETTEPRLEQ